MNISIVTGASRGIGRAIAKRIAKDSSLLLVSRNEDELRKLTAEIICDISKGQNTTDYVVGDVKDPSVAKAAVEKAKSLGTLRNVILNAGISKSGPAAAFPDATLRDLFDTNFFGSVNFVKEALPALLEQKAGNIIFLAGTAGLQGYSSMSGYCASKHALIGYAKSLAQEVSKKGVQVVPVCPGPVDTDMTGTIVKFLVSKGMTEEAAKKKIAEGSNQKRLITPEEVAESIADICACNGKVMPNLDGTPYSFGSRPELALYA